MVMGISFAALRFLSTADTDPTESERVLDQCSEARLCAVDLSDVLRPSVERNAWTVKLKVIFEAVQRII